MEVSACIPRLVDHMAEVGQNTSLNPSLQLEIHVDWGTSTGAPSVI